MFFILNDLITRFGDSEINNLYNIREKDLYNNVENTILQNPATEELKDLNLGVVESRWDIFYRKKVRKDEETNNVLIYYNVTNDILRNILINKRPLQIIYSLKRFMSV